MRLDLLADRLHGGVRAQEAIGQCLVFAQQAQQQVLGLDIGRAELAGLIPRKEDHAPCLLRIAFEHFVLPDPGYRLKWPSGNPAPASALRRALPFPRRQRPKQCLPAFEELSGWSGLSCPG